MKPSSTSSRSQCKWKLEAQFSLVLNKWKHFHHLEMSSQLVCFMLLLPHIISFNIINIFNYSSPRGWQGLMSGRRFPEKVQPCSPPWIWYFSITKTTEGETRESTKMIVLIKNFNQRQLRGTSGQVDDGRLSRLIWVIISCWRKIVEPSFTSLIWKLEILCWTGGDSRNIFHFTREIFPGKGRYGIFRKIPSGGNLQIFSRNWNSSSTWDLI